ncbi:exopolysaccharide biosynthesis polyprenyl glycosylphosphotransferase [Natrialba hulunbeirensis JCM 10989]|uniref:Exopolysaccharide biosynthesis polyprenyl glycosylphosphotransferase n=1 Tax=Natrialba hulunbeirensis JCM 10989 TaxID=1227493 RepID=M0A605_9EURY|nr:sugar transferase [Natrialba hulunbeirensis]ELY93781.1 exopolysaccharide biosynthesis polyprenyl glycosylphosphotransferase [Natrialba hulunbeirensis JCM 10989]
MLTGWRFRIGSMLGVMMVTITAVLAANHPVSQTLFTTYVPLFNRLEVTVLSGPSLYWAITLSVVAVVGCLTPLYKPQPRRTLDLVVFSQKRVIVALLALAALGYFKWSHRLPRATLAMIAGMLLVAIPLLFLVIRRHPGTTASRTLIVGDDLGQIERIAPEIDAPVLGYLCPSTVATFSFDERTAGTHLTTDGGVVVGDTPKQQTGDHDHDPDGEASDETAPNAGTLRHEDHGTVDSLTRLGGLSRLEDVLIEYDIDTVVLAFQQPDRAEFFGALDACHEHGVRAKVHRKYADSVLVANGAVDTLVDIDLEPWDPFDHFFKRVFDICFAAVGLLVFAPLMLVIALAIKLDSPGPVLYSQHRTAGFGETFPVYKFRTMVPEGESATPTDDEDNDRITRVGRVLRTTHLDELPQLWSILLGEMSVVGPRAVWTSEEPLLEQDVPAWRKRWFVKPGLTGLAQINDAKSTDPNMKLRYDLEYIRKQSIWFDCTIVIRQLWKVLEDIRR